MLKLLFYREQGWDIFVLRQFFNWNCFNGDMKIRVFVFYFFFNDIVETVKKNHYVLRILEDF